MLGLGLVLELGTEVSTTEMTTNQRVLRTVMKAVETNLGNSEPFFRLAKTLLGLGQFHLEARVLGHEVQLVRI